MTALLIRQHEKAKLAMLSALAFTHPVDMTDLMKAIKTVEGKALHMKQMSQQTINIPMAYMVTFSIEENHPCGTCRHMSMSVQKPGRAPNEHALWMIAEELGFWGSLKDCTVYPEQLEGHGLAINVIQPLQQPTSH